MNFFKPIIFSAVLAFSTPAFAQEVVPPDPDFNEEEIVRYLNENLPRIRPKKLILVEDTIEIHDPIIYADTLRFDNGGVLRLRTSNSKSILLVARKIILPPSGAHATIVVTPAVVLDGAHASQHSALPAHDWPRSSGNGRHGTDGSDGNQGGNGRTYHQPTLFIVSETMRLPNGTPPDELMRFIVDADGIDGGRGGDGGDGQNGQPGQDGRHGEADNFGFCSSGPRSGGNGGDGGDYGPGGRGGDGGDGGTIVFVVHPDLEPVIDNVRARTRPGLGGRGGRHGVNGKSAGGGSRGSRPGRCDGARPGDKGADGTPKPTDFADTGSDSIKNGSILLYAVETIPEVFEIAELVESNRVLGEGEWGPVQTETD